MVVIDGHTHFAGPGNGFPPNTVEDLLAIMDGNGIDSIVTCAPYSSIGKDRTYDDANRFLVESMSKAPERIIGFLRVNPHLQEHALRSIEDGVKNQSFKGVKVHPRNEAFAINSEELAFPIAELASKLKVPILIHTGEPDTYGFAQPTLVGDLADSFPDLTLIIGHMGKRLYEDAICVARWFENIILETSFRSHRDIARAVKRVGADRVVYGSDMPFGVPEIEMMKVRLADITSEEKGLVLGDNMARTLGLGVDR
ncbi:amidohydrolase [Candidatus Bathyarchaeota archaeon]|nr:amidohydrolase [Candidatus Bathyarchaeota archaeon]